MLISELLLSLNGARLAHSLGFQQVSSLHAKLNHANQLLAAESYLLYRCESGTNLVNQL